MTIATLQPGIGMGSMCEGCTRILMTVGAQFVDAGRFGLLAVLIVARFAIDPHLTMLAGFPLIGRGFVAARAQTGIWRDRHGLLGVTFLEWTMAGFAGDAGFGEFSGSGIETSGMTFQTSIAGSLLGPILLKDG